MITTTEKEPVIRTSVTMTYEILKKRIDLLETNMIKAQAEIKDLYEDTTEIANQVGRILTILKDEDKKMIDNHLIESNAENTNAIRHLKEDIEEIKSKLVREGIMTY